MNAGSSMISHLEEKPYTILLIVEITLCFNMSESECWNFHGLYLLIGMR